MTLRFAPTFLLVLLTSATGFAQTAAPANSPGASLASAHYETGTAEYRAGNFAAAAVEFREAYRLSDDPVLLFNIGSALADAGDMPGALEAFEAYLQALPQAPNRGIVEGRINVLRSRIAASAPPAAPSSSPEPAASPSPAEQPMVAPPIVREWHVPIGGIVVGTAGVLIAASSAVFYALRGSAIATCNDDGTAIVCPDRATADAGIAYSAATNWTLGVGAALALGGATWIIVSRATFGPARSTAAIAPLPEGGALLTFGGRF